MRLRHDVTVEQAIKALGERISDSQQASAHTASGPADARQAYLNWVNTTQQHLRTIFSDTELEDSLVGRGYWHICGMTIPSSRREALLQRLIREELVFQVGYPGIHGDPGGRLGEVATRLRALTRLAARPGRICIPDTNALLHYTRFDQLLWAERMQVGLVRLVIPLVVVEELDGKKYARRGEFQQRAREMLTLIDRYATTSPPDGYSEVRKNVTVEMLPDEPGHLRMSSSDQEILERCEFLHQVTGNQATLITGDTGMRINARVRGIDVFKLSDDDLLPRYKQQETDSVVSRMDVEG
jgi:rRNA-processing protein FCF1